MDTRKIMIANTRTQKRNELLTDATTLGELKAAMNEAGIDYSDMTFTEGISKTQLISDDSLLPTNVKYKGEITNDLVILLTNTTKKIPSGCSEGRTRKEAYAIINEQGEDFKNAIKEEFGANYTLITTENLWLFIDENLDLDEDEHDDEEEEETEDEQEELEEEYNSDILVCHLYDTIKTLLKMGTFNYEDLKALSAGISELLSEAEKQYTLGGSTISDGDIDNMIAEIN